MHRDMKLNTNKARSIFLIKFEMLVISHIIRANRIYLMSLTGPMSGGGAPPH